MKNRFTALLLILVLLQFPSIIHAETEEIINLAVKCGELSATVSWKNGSLSNVGRIDLYNSSNQRIASSAAAAANNVTVLTSGDGRLSKNSGDYNAVSVSGLEIGNVYSYKVRFIHNDGSQASEYEISSEVLKEKINSEYGGVKDDFSIKGWDFSYSENPVVNFEINNIYNGEKTLFVTSNLGGGIENTYTKIVPEINEELHEGQKYIFSFYAKAQNQLGFDYGAGTKIYTETENNFDWKKISFEFTYTNNIYPYVILNKGCEGLYLADFSLRAVNSYGQETKNLLSAGNFEDIPKGADSLKPINFMAVGRDKRLTVSWRNPYRDDITDITLKNSFGEVIADKSTLLTGNNDRNAVVESGLENLRAYNYKITLRFEDGEEYTEECMSNALKDAGKTLWGNPVEAQSVYGWKLVAAGNTYTDYEMQFKTAHSGDGALLVRNNLNAPITGTYQQIGPELTNELVVGKKYRFSYWRKGKNVEEYFAGYGGRNGVNAIADSTDNEEWEKITLADFTADGNDVRFVFNKGCEELYIDDVELYELDGQGNIMGENLIKNGSFDLEKFDMYKAADKARALLDKCESLNIPVDYEKSQVKTLEYFASYLLVDLDDNVPSDRMEYNRNAFFDIYTRVVQSLNDKIAGQKLDAFVPKYITSNIETDGQSFVADAEANGVIYHDRPIFFVGYMGYDAMKNTIPSYSDYGHNIVQVEIGPSGMAVSADNEKGYEIDPAGASSLINTLKRAAESNITVNVLISPHYMPSFMYEKYPELKMDMPGFFNYDVTTPIARQVLSDYLDVLVPLIKDIPSLHSICLTNEPAFHSIAGSEKSSFKTKWETFLNNKYGGIENLNSVYNSAYAYFSEVPMPVSADDAAQPKDDNSARFNDYILFNNEIFVDFHRFLAEKIRTIAPDIPLHTKMQSNIFVEDSAGKGGCREILFRGNDYEKLSEFLDINGNDAVSHYYSNHWFRDLEKSLFYDMQRSVRDVPVYNSEEHLIWDGTELFTKEQAIQMYNDLWQGAIHGRSASTIWLWDRTNNSSSSNYCSIMHRPDCVENIGKVSLDLNRLAYEVTALQKKKSDVAILYSKYSRNLNITFLTTLMNAYMACLYSGQKVEFVTEDTIEKINDYDSLIIPRASCVTDNTVNKIADYIKNGGKTLILASDSLKYNENEVVSENSERHDNRNYIMENSQVMEIAYSGASIKTSGVRQCVKDWLKNNGKVTVELVDADTGEQVSDTEWLAVEYNGGWLVNAANYDWGADKKVNVYINGEKCSGITDLISGESFGETIALCKHTPRLLSINADKQEYELSANVILQNGERVATPQSGSTVVKKVVKNNSKMPQKFTLAAAIYKNGSLVRVNTAEKIIDANTEDEISVAMEFPEINKEFTYGIYLWNGMGTVTVN